MFDNFFENLHYFKFKDNYLLFNNKKYYVENFNEKYNNIPLIDLFNSSSNPDYIFVLTLLYDIYKDLNINWDRTQGFDGSKKYIDRIGLVKYFDERLKQYKTVTIKNYRFYNIEDEQLFELRKPSTLYDLIYA